MATYTSNYGWTKPSGSDNVDISVLNNNLDDQDSTIHDAFLNMAPPFSESSTYAVDDIVLYTTGLYKCHTPVVTPGSWTGSTNWQVHKLSEGGSGGGGYVLPVATASRLGGVKIGSGISVEEDGTISASGGGSGEIKNLDNGMLSHVTDSSYITVNLDVPLIAGKEYKITIRDAQYNYVDTKQIIWTSDVDVVFPGVGSSGSYGIRLTQTTVSLYNYGGTGWRDIYCDIVSDFSSENYNDFTNKPSINGVTLSGNKTTSDLGIDKTAVGLGNVPNVTTNDQTPTFTQASTRNNIASGEKLSVILGKIAKFFNDLKTVAFSGSFSDLTDKPNADDILMSDGVTSVEDAISNYTNIKTVTSDGIKTWKTLINELFDGVNVYLSSDVIFTIAQTRFCLNYNASTSKRFTSIHGTLNVESVSYNPVTVANTTFYAYGITTSAITATNKTDVVPASGEKLRLYARSK